MLDRMRALLLLLVPTAAAAAPLEMRYLRAENLHIANQGGAMNWHDEITLTLDLQPTGKLVGRETGRVRKHDLHVLGTSSYTTEDLQQWTHRWRGTWKQTGAQLALDVVLDSRACTRVTNSSDAPTEKKTCGTVSKQIHFDCTTEQITLMSPPTAPIKRDVWQCLPSGTVDLDRTPTPWTFGKTSCVKVLGGRSGLEYDRC
jgi:hypothetical protein